MITMVPDSRPKTTAPERVYERLFPTSPLSKEAAGFLSRFPGPVRIPGRVKSLAILALAIYLPILGLPIGVYLDTGGGRPTPLVVALGIALIIGMLTMIGLALRMLLTPDYGDLALDGAGLEYQVGFRRLRCSWKDADGFGTYMRVVRGVVLGPYAAFEDASRARGFNAACTRYFTGGGNVRLANTRLGADELVRLLTTWRELALERTPAVQQP